MPYPDERVVGTAAPTGPAVGAVTTEVLAANQARISAVFVNDSAEAMYLARGVPAVMHRGIRLNAYGGAYEINKTNLFLGAVNAICASGGMVLCVDEGVE